MDRDTFLKGMAYCQLHNFCRDCPIKSECKGAYDMLSSAFIHINEIHEENERLRSEK